MELLKKIYLVTTLLCLCLVQLTAQKLSRIEFKVNHHTGFLEEIFFNDFATGKLIKKFDVSQNDPYGSLPFPLKKLYKNPHKFYDLSKSSKDSYSMLLSDKYLTINTKQSDTSVLIDGLLKRVTLGRTDTMAGFVAVSYNLTAYKNDFPISFISTIIIIDSRGDIVQIINNINTESNFPTISQNGKFIIINYGGELDCSNNQLFHPSFRIINTETKEIIHDEEFISDRVKKIGRYTSDSGIPLCLNNMFVIVSRSLEKENRYLYQVFDPEQKKVYIKSFDTYIFNDEIKPDGIYHKKDKFLFEKDFLTLDFQGATQKITSPYQMKA